MPLRRLTILTFREPHGRWTARILEHDMSAEGRTQDMAIDLSLRLARAHIAYDIRHNREPLSAFGPAPQIFWDAFQGAAPLPLPSGVDDLDDRSPIELRIAVSKHCPTLMRLVPRLRTA